MRITPLEVLYCLGFDVPPEGIEINPNERRFYIEAFRALGKTIDVSAIPEAALVNLYKESTRLVGETIDVSTIPDALFRDLNTGFKKFVLACNNEQPHACRRVDSDVAGWLSALLGTNLSIISKQQTIGLPLGGLCILDDAMNTQSKA
jgi:hypothetical protein